MRDSAMELQRSATTVHMSAFGLRSEEDGWFYPECSCGQGTGPVLDLETAVDFLMGHAVEKGREMAVAALRHHREEAE